MGSRTGDDQPVIGLLADPDLPVEVAPALSDSSLPRTLAAHWGSARTTRLHAAGAQSAIAAGRSHMSVVLDAAANHREREG